MNAAELIAELQSVPPDTQIRVWCDHGQSCMKASTASLHMIRKEDADEWMCDTVSKLDIAEDPEEYDGVELVQIFEIGAP